MILEITTNVGCPVGCSYCPQDKLLKAYDGPREMSFRTFFRCMRSVLKDVQIMFAGMSEPFMNQSCLDMICLASESGHEVSVYTTTVGLRNRDATYLGAIPFKAFVVHEVDVTSPEILKRCSVLADNFSIERRIWASSHSRAGNLNGKSHPNHKGNLSCSASPDFHHNVLMPNGDVHLCCMDYSLKHKIGNLLTDKWEDLKRPKKGVALCRKCNLAV